MMKKIVSLALAMVCASNLVVAAISDEDVVLAGKTYAEQMINEGKTEQLKAELNELAITASGSSKASMSTRKAALLIGGALTVVGLSVGYALKFNEVNGFFVEKTPVVTGYCCDKASSVKTHAIALYDWVIAKCSKNPAPVVEVPTDVAAEPAAPVDGNAGQSTVPASTGGSAAV